MRLEQYPAHVWLSRAVQALAALAGLYFGYNIGSRISGPGMGVVMALNAAVCAALLVAVPANWVRRRRR